jgi:hypothetical protein
VGSDAGPVEIESNQLIVVLSVDAGVHIQLSLSSERIIGKKQVGGWKHAPVVAWRSNPGKQSAVVLTAWAFAAASAFTV